MANWALGLVVHLYAIGDVDRFSDWVPLNKTTHGKLNKYQISYISISIKLIDRLGWILYGNWVSKLRQYLILCDFQGQSKGLMGG